MAAKRRGTKTFCGISKKGENFFEHQRVYLPQMEQLRRQENPPFMVDMAVNFNTLNTTLQGEEAQRFACWRRWGAN